MTVTIGADVYACWREALMGRVLPADQHLPTGLGGVDGHPQPGLYKMREGGGYDNGVKQAHRWVPVKIVAATADGVIAHKWAEGLQVSAVIGKDKVADALKIWVRCLTRDATGKVAVVNAISRDAYAHWLQHERWPDEPASNAAEEVNTVPARATQETSQPEAAARAGTDAQASEERAAPPAGNEGDAGIGHNSDNDPEGIAALMELLTREDASTQTWIAKGQEGESAANFAKNWETTLGDLEKRVLAAFTAEKEPHLRKCQEIDEKWRPVKAFALEIKKRMNAAFNGIAKRETDRRQAIANEQARLKAEELRKAQEAEHARRVEEQRVAREAAAAQAREAGELPLAEPAPPPPPPPTPPQVVAETVRMTFGGATGRRAAPRATPKVALITDWKAAAAHYALADKVKAEVQKLADADAKKGIRCPGAQIVDKAA